MGARAKMWKPEPKYGRMTQNSEERAKFERKSQNVGAGAKIREKGGKIRRNAQNWVERANF